MLGKMKRKKMRTSSKVDGLDYSGDRYTTERPDGPVVDRLSGRISLYGH